jgi:hypothetical protein
MSATNASRYFSGNGPNLEAATERIEEVKSLQAAAG